MERKLYRSREDRKLGGVCGGIAEYLNIDSTLIRVLWVLFVLAVGSGILAYIVCWLLIPEKPVSEQKGEIIYCTKCGTENSKDAKFCKNCGTAIPTSV